MIQLHNKNHHDFIDFILRTKMATWLGGSDQITKGKTFCKAVIEVILNIWKSESEWPSTFTEFLIWGENFPWIFLSS